MEDYAESFYAFERECVDVMFGRREPPRTVEEYLRTLACTFAAYESADRAIIVETP